MVHSDDSVYGLLGVCCLGAVHTQPSNCQGSTLVHGCCWSVEGVSVLNKGERDVATYCQLNTYAIIVLYVFLLLKCVFDSPHGPCYCKTSEIKGSQHIIVQYMKNFNEYTYL